jgi:hypothetical protein
MPKKTTKSFRDDGLQTTVLSSLTRPDGPRHRPHANVHGCASRHQHGQEVRREKHDSSDQQEPEPTQLFQPLVLFLLGFGSPGRLDAGPIPLGPRLALASILPSAVVTVLRVVFVFGLIIVGRFSLVVGLSRVVEVLREASSAAAAVVEVEAGAAGESTATGESATAGAKGSWAAASHHAEKDVGVDVVAHAAAKHVGGVRQVHAAVVALALPAGVVVSGPE